MAIAWGAGLLIWIESDGPWDWRRCARGRFVLEKDLECPEESGSNDDGGGECEWDWEGGGGSSE